MNELIEELIQNGWTKEEAEEMVVYLKEYDGIGKKELMDLLTLYLAFKEIKNESCS